MKEIKTVLEIRKCPTCEMPNIEQDFGRLQNHDQYETDENGMNDKIVTSWECVVCHASFEIIFEPTRIINIEKSEE